MDLRFSLRSFFPIFVIVGIVVAGLKVPNDAWGGVFLSLTLAGLVWSIAVAVYGRMPFALGVPTGFLAYMSLAGTYFCPLNPLCDWLIYIDPGANYCHMLHLVAGWLTGLVGGFIARSVARHDGSTGGTIARWSIFCITGLVLAVSGLPQPSAWIKYTALIGTLTLLLHCVPVATYRRNDPFALGFVSAFAAYTSVGGYYCSILNPMSDYLLTVRRTVNWHMADLVAAWVTGLTGGVIACIVAMHMKRMRVQ